jgi:hypothetical protein
MPDLTEPLKGYSPDRGFSPERIMQGLRHIYIDGVKVPFAPKGRADEHPTV